METVFDNRYTILGELGSGGAGKVFLARDEVLGREVALKILRTLDVQRNADTDLIRRFEREALVFFMPDASVEGFREAY